mgnify:CR=1 FL=1
MLNLPLSGGGVPDPYVPPDGTWNVTGSITASGTISAAAFTATGFTEGSVIFAGASGAFAQDNTNFFWDDTNNQLILGSGTALLPAYTFASDPNTGMYRVGADSLALAVGGAAGFTLATTGATGTQAISTSGSPVLLTLTGAAHTTLTASVEAVDIYLNLGRTVQFGTGALATQRAFRIAAPTYGFVGATTLTNAYTLYVDSAPVAGTFATITNTYAAFFGGTARIEANTSAAGVPLLWLANPTGGGIPPRLLFTFSTGSLITDGAFIDLDTSNLNIRVREVGGITLGTSDLSRWTIWSDGHLTGALDNTYDIGQAGLGRVRNLYVYTAIHGPVGTALLPGFRFLDDPNTGMYQNGADNLGLSTGGVLRLNIDATGDVSITQGAGGAGTSPTGFTFTGAAHLNLATTVEATDAYFDLSRTVQFATGAITTQRAFRIDNPTYGFVGASTITDAYTFYVDAPPAAGTFATITRAWAGFLGGPLELNGTPADTNMLLAVRSNTVNSVMRFHASDTGTAASDGLEIGILSSAARVLNREAGALSLGTTANTRISISAGGTLTHTMSAQTSGAHTMHTMTAAANTGQTVGTEIPDVLFDLARTNTWATGALALQRAFRITQPTYDFTAASTLTTAATVAIAGAPTQGASASIVQSFALYFDGGAVTLASAAGMMTGAISIQPRTVTVTGTTQVTSLNAEIMIEGTTYTDASAVTMDAVTGIGIVPPIAAGSVAMTQVSGARIATSVSYATHGAGFNYAAYRAGSHTITFTGTTQITATPAVAGMSIGQITLTNAGAHTIDSAASLYIAAAPVAAGSVTLSNTYALWVDAGISRFDGQIGIGNGSLSAPAIYFQSDVDTGISYSAGPVVSFSINSTERLRVYGSGIYVPNTVFCEAYQASSSTGSPLWSGFRAFAFTQTAQNAATFTGFAWTGGAHTALTASTEATDINFNLARTVEFATGALALQRAFRVQAPTYGFVGASTLTTAATVAIGGGPTQGTNATISQSFNLYMEAGAVTLASAAGAFSSTIGCLARTVTFTGTTQITNATNTAIYVGSITYTDASALTMDNAQTVNISAPIGAGLCAITTVSGYRISDNVSYATHAAGFNYAGYRLVNHTITFTATTGITSTPGIAGMFLGQITATNAGAHTIDNAATLYIAGACIAGGSAVITNNYALWVDAGVCRFDGDGTTVFVLPTLAATDTTITRKIRILDGVTTYWIAATTSQ